MTLALFSSVFQLNFEGEALALRGTELGKGRGPMTQVQEFIHGFADEYQSLYNKRKILLTFIDFLELVEDNPRKFIRNSAHYLLDTFKHFGRTPLITLDPKYKERFNLFDLGTERSGPIIGGENVHHEIFSILNSFNRNGFVSKLILLHGPNGSAKSSTVETISKGMEKYSLTDEGAIYRFNWIFPLDKDKVPRGHGELQPIGFGKDSGKQNSDFQQSYALLEESKIASKLTSEFKENPLFLIPMPYREKILRKWLAKKENCREEDVSLPAYILNSGLSKKNQEIFDNLLNAHDGDVYKVFRYIQVERFFFSRQYRVGISTIEPQMSIDASEKQLTLDKNLLNLPSVLQTMNFHQVSGELIEANRGILEFSDLLKRPVEAFKYLLATIEKGTITLPTSTAFLDMVFVGTTNDKHLDAFKVMPDFSSFKGRFELINVPYLLLPQLEEKIYETDLKSISKIKHIAPHTISILCNWSVMTRLKQPDPDFYPKKYRYLVAKIDPKHKVRLYQGLPLQPFFTIEEQNFLEEIKEKMWTECQDVVIYEGRFGASPREIRAILQKASQNPNHEDLTPMTIFDELSSMIKDRSIYEFLQFEARGKYHDVEFFIETLKKDFVDAFEKEVIHSMSLAEEAQYDSLLKRYITHVVADIKREKILDETSNNYTSPSTKIMTDVENILKISMPADEFRASLLNRIAAFRIEKPQAVLDLTSVFKDLMGGIKQHFYEENKKVIEENFKAMITIETEKDSPLLSEKAKADAELTYRNLIADYGYTRRSAFKCLAFILANKS
jgi:serine protein kinase